MSEIRDTIAVLDAHEIRLDEAEARDVRTNKRIDDLIAHIERFERKTDGLFTILRDGIAEECRLLREGINRGRY